MDSKQKSVAAAATKRLKRLDLKQLPEFTRSPACGFVPGMVCEVCGQPMAHMCEGLISLGHNVASDFYRRPVTAFAVIQQCVRPHHLSCHSEAPLVLPLKAKSKVKE
jgi:hypothetical protein